MTTTTIPWTTGACAPADSKVLQRRRFPVRPVRADDLAARCAEIGAAATTTLGALPPEVSAALLDCARFVRMRAYAPYSNFSVGAALLARDGRVFIGTNVENASYGLSICAERAAIATALSAGAEPPFAMLAVAGPPDRTTTPCGACRQVMLEFGEALRVVIDGPGGALETTAGELLPAGFALP